jgi:malate synthase
VYFFSCIGGANVYMADFEDSSSPTWKNLIEGQINLRDAVRGTITYTNPSNQKEYRLKDKEKCAKLFVRPRGWHLDEAHVTVNGRVASGSLFDFSLFFYHNVHECIKQGSGVYLYLPKVRN